MDLDMVLMFEKGIRGGITQTVYKMAEANNPYMGEDYDMKRPTIYIQCLDANNLYGWAMSQSLPTGEFKWKQVENRNPITILEELSDKIELGYLLDVDVSYPKELHDDHNDLPFMCNKRDVNGVKKLVADLHYKKNYVIHIRALTQAIEHGLILEKINKIIEFKQSPWMKDYIDYNTMLRTAAKNDFEKDFYKLMNNSVFGKTMENIRKRKT